MMEDGGELIRDNNEERIFVSVRLRPLNEKEISNNDVSDWECISSDTIVCKNGVTSERSTYPNAYTFDRVFKSDCSMRMVYEQGAKNAAISVVRGVNATVLAYGETSSGKTHTMTGISEYAVADIYDYIAKHPEREFVVKFSAMEICNESIRDLLSSDNTPLKLVDDPERGTVVENLTEEVLRDRDHVTELLFICEAQRQTGEILQNGQRPQSHQITKLTIESSPRDYSGWDTPCSLKAVVHFVDLAASEQAGTSLKQGSRVDQSLVTLGAVIRKLSKGGNEHIPYRDSKLTQVLQTSLSGNARISIMCMISPARSHVEQSRNALHFASCAKDVTTCARVNVVVSDKPLVKRLQRDLARLENELRSSQPKFTSGSFSALLREKDAQIEMLEKEVRDLILQRDIFQSQVKELLKMLGDTASSISQAGAGNYPHLRVLRSPDVYVQDQDPQYSDYADTCDGLSRSNSGYRAVKVVYLDLENSNASPNISIGCPSFSESDLFHGWHEIDKQTTSNLEDVCREANCPDKEYCGTLKETATTNYSYFQKSARLPATKVYINGAGQSSLAKDQELMLSSPEEDSEVKDETPSTSRIMSSNEVQEPASETVIKGGESTSCSTTPAKEGDHSSIKCPNNAPLHDHQAKTSIVGRGFNLVRSQSWDCSLVSDSVDKFGKKLCTLNSKLECESLPEYALDNTATPAGETSSADAKEQADSPTEKEITSIKEKEIASETNGSAKKGLKEIGLGAVTEKGRGLTSWPVEFKRLQSEILELWHACNVSLVHRTYFFMLFQGDPTDAIYLEVEIRRMKLLKGKFSRGDKIVVDGQRLTLSSSAKALRQERRMLSEQMLKKLSEQERESLFVKWGIDLNSKLRRMQLGSLVWTKHTDINHVNESANIVARLVGFLEPGHTPSREVFGMNLTPKYSTGICTYKRSLGSLL